MRNILLFLLLITRLAAAAPGPLIHHPTNGRYFTTQPNGPAIMLTGSHTWNNFRDIGTTDPPLPFDWPLYLTWLTQRNHNFIRLWQFELTQYQYGTAPIHYVDGPWPWPRTGPGVALDGKPKFNLAIHDQNYFDRLRYRVESANNADIYVGVVLFEGHALRLSNLPWRWNAHPFHPANNINAIDGGDGNAVHTLTNPSVVAIQEAYVAATVTAINDLPNVIYEIANESHTDSLAWQLHMADFLRNLQSGLSYVHPVGWSTVHPNGNNINLLDPAARVEWIAPNGDSGGQTYANNNLITAATGDKVSIIDTDHIQIFDRIWFWKIFMRGHQISMMDRPLDPAYSFREARRRTLGVQKMLSELVDLAGLTPQTAGENSPSSTGWCLHKPGQYLAYQPTPTLLTLQVTPGRYSIRWINPRTGEIAEENHRTLLSDVIKLIPPASIIISAGESAGEDSVVLLTRY